MIFSAIAAILNAVGWIGYYYFSGGWFEETETAEVRVQTIAAMIIVSVIAGVVSAVSKNLLKNVFCNFLHVWVSTAIISASFCALVYFDLSFGQIAICFIIWFFVFAIYYAAFPGYIHNNLNGVPWYIRLIVVLLSMAFATLYPEGAGMNDILVGAGFLVGIPISIVTSIGYTFFDFG